MQKWQSALAHPNISLSDAIPILDRGALRIVLVVDEQNRLLGTLTDGDLRRALLRQQPLSTPLCEVMTTHPKVARHDWSKARMLALMEKDSLLQLPILDSSGVLVGLETLHGLLQKPRQHNPVFLMAGGFGTRLRPLTNTCPKPMLRIGSKPILELILESFINAGFYRFYISTHYMPEQIQSYFGDGGRWNVEIQYIHEQTPLGTGGALGLLPHDEIDHPLFMMNGDLLTDLNFLSLLAFHEEQGGVATMCVREYEQQIPYGVIESEGYQMRNMVEKPTYRFKVNAGIYLLDPDLVKTVMPGQIIDMPTLLQQQVETHQQVNLFTIPGYWLDIGRMEDFQKAQEEYASI